MLVRAVLNEPDWDSINAKNLSDFLNSPTGERLVAKLLFERPSYGDRLDRLVESGKIEGYQDAIENIFSYCELVKPPQQEVENYPDPEDDSKWTHISATEKE